MFDLKNKTALITGASRGLGAAVATLAWSCGAHLVLAARSEDKLRELQNKLLISGLKGQKISIFKSDLSDPEAAFVLMKNFEKECSGGVDILFNVAATHGAIGPLWETDWAEWQSALQVNLLSPVTLCRACISHMVKQNYGKIINLSGGGASKARPNFSAYAVSKVGLVRFSETLAEEVRKYQIDVNCVAPGIMKSELLNEVISLGPEVTGQEEYNIARKLHNLDSAQRAAELCIYLASKKSDGITGKLISAVWDPWPTLHDRIDELNSTDIYTLRRITPKERGMDWGDVE